MGETFLTSDCRGGLVRRYYTYTHIQHRQGSKRAVLTFAEVLDVVVEGSSLLLARSAATSALTPVTRHDTDYTQYTHSRHKGLFLSQVSKRVDITHMHMCLSRISFCVFE